MQNGFACILAFYVEQKALSANGLSMWSKKHFQLIVSFCNNILGTKTVRKFVCMSCVGVCERITIDKCVCLFEVLFLIM